MKPSTLAALLACLAVGCKTGQVSGVKDDAPGPAPGSFHCAFVSPGGTGDNYQVWAAPTDGSQLKDVSELQTTARDPTGTKTAIGTAPAVDATTLTSGGTRGLRSYFKSLLAVNAALYDCFSLRAVSDTTSASYLCVAKAPDAAGGRAAMWATNLSREKFAKELTVYQATCTPQ